MFFPILYAETHFRLKYLSPAYFKKEAEVIFEIPSRVLLSRTQNKLPIFLLIKDADKYPVTISNININIICNKKIRKISLDEIIIEHRKLTYHKFEIELSSEEVKATDIKVNIHFFVNNTLYINDNYYPSTPHNFKVYISEKDRIFPEGWFLGDVHYHSSYTEDFVEFGAPIEMTKSIAYVMGLDWFFVTDHSYDLDDSEDDYTKTDETLPKWKKMKSECKELSDNKLNIVFGEEVSLKNSLNENIHCIVMNNEDFVFGDGDSAERWFTRKSENNNIPTLPACKEDTLQIAAHPLENVPFMQKLLLKRGNWSYLDFDLNKIEYLQMLNGKNITETLAQIDNYFRILQTGRRFYLLAGNDAHGNFQYMKQIKIPFLSLICKKEQVFGNYFTAINHNENNPIEGIKRKNIVVSNGPFIDFKIENDKVFYNYKLENYHGEIDKLQLILGFKNFIKRIDLDPVENVFLNTSRSKNIFFISMIIITKNGYMALKNPVFFDEPMML